MERTTGEAPATGQELYRFLDRTLLWLETGTIAVVLLITLAQPTESRVGLPTWGRQDPGTFLRIRDRGAHRPSA